MLDTTLRSRFPEGMTPPLKFTPQGFFGRRRSLCSYLSDVFLFLGLCLFGLFFLLYVGWYKATGGLNAPMTFTGRMYCVILIMLLVLPVFIRLPLFLNAPLNIWVVSGIRVRCALLLSGRRSAEHSSNQH